jgi:hemerythrin-like domain-containing protein
MTVLIEVLHEEHRNVERLLRALESQIETFGDGGAPDYDIIVGVADYFLGYPDRCHHPKEDLIAAKLKQAHPEAIAALPDLSGEHRALHQAAQAFRETVSALLNETDIPRASIVDAGRAFIDSQRRHLQMEESHFLPVADRLLTPADWADLDIRRSEQTDPVFGDRVEEMFRTLSRRLLAWEAENERSAS